MSKRGHVHKWRKVWSNTGPRFRNGMFDAVKVLEVYQCTVKSCREMGYPC